MKDYRTILRRVGWVLIVGGLIDIGFMVYCIVNRTSYSSSFSIFAVIAGIFLLKGSLKVTRIISMFMAFFIAAFVGVLVILPFLLPFDLLLISMKLAPATAVLRFIFVPAIMALLVWIYRELTSPTVRTAMDEAGVNYSSFWRKPARGFWIGGSLALLLLILLFLLMGGATADEAKQRVAAQLGEGYKFHVSSINISSGTNGKHVHAVVTAYNDTEIKDIVVEWSE